MTDQQLTMRTSSLEHDHAPTARRDPGSVPRSRRPRPAGRAVRVVVVDPDASGAAGRVGALLEHSCGDRLAVVGATVDPAAASTLVLRTNPRVVVVVGATRGLMAFVDRHLGDHPRMGVLALVRDAAQAELHELCGVQGILPHDAPADCLAGSILAVTAGMVVRPPGAARTSRASSERAVLSELDEEQLDLWRAVARGDSDRQIAERSYHSLRTTKRRVAALLCDLGVSRRIEAATLAGRLGVDLGRVDGFRAEVAGRAAGDGHPVPRQPRRPE